MTSTENSAPRYIGLDLLRAVAISLVLACHLIGTAVVPFGITDVLWIEILGHLGVELFFILSGYLIGNLLIDIVAAGPSLRQWAIFMVRRMLRTMPAYFVWLALLMAFKPAHVWRDHVLQFATFTQNLAWPMVTMAWFPISWSLAVEEWFYLLFSIAALTLAALMPRIGLWLAIAAFLAVPLALRFATPIGSDWDSAVRTVVALRLDAIGYGVLLANMMRTGTFLQRHWLACLALGLALLAGTVAWWLLDIRVWNATDLLWRSLMLNAVSVAFALMVPAALRLRLAKGPLATAIGTTSLLSYGLYLDHISMLDMTRSFYKGGTSALTACVGLGFATVAAFAVAWVSYRFFEAPILALRPRQGGRARQLSPRPIEPASQSA